MIIIDERATEKVIPALKSLPMMEEAYAIYFRHVPGFDQTLRLRFIEQLERQLPDSELYCCEDGDTVLLTQNATFKQCNQAMYDSAQIFGVQYIETFARLFSDSNRSRELSALLEQKMQRIRDEEIKREEVRRNAEAARKRQEILQQETFRTPQQISEYRSLREKPCLMIIEDDVFSRRLVEKALFMRYTLASLDSADNALTTYSKLAPDLIFLDINLPDVSGHELLEKILLLDPEAFIVMLSGNADRQNIMQAMQRGAKGFVAKPFSPDKLYHYIDRCPTIKKEKII